MLGKETVTLSSHVCRYRDDDTRWLSRIYAWWLLPAHFFASTAVAALLICIVDQRNFLVSGPPDSRVYNVSRTSVLYQSDVTTLISIALLVVRVVAGSWITLAGWRMCFCVLEVDGASMGQVLNMIQYRMPPLYKPI